MKRALIRLEDIAPGGIYGNEENLRKLRIIADYLQSEKVPYHVSIIPRYIDPFTSYDKSIADTNDPYIRLFNKTMQYLNDHGGGHSLGMHGYTHQFHKSVSGDGTEFYHSQCTSNCPPDDSQLACFDRNAFAKSYTSIRMRSAYKAFAKAKLYPDWGFSTPHYIASANQRHILESWSGIFFENDPMDFYKRSVSIRDSDSAFYRGVIYVPTPLDYVSAADPEKDINRICQELNSYNASEIAAFFYHPFMEFQFIEIYPSRVTYHRNSYLKRLIRCFKAQGFSFVSLLSLVTFVPSSRQTDIFPGEENHFFSADIDGDGKTDLVIWQPKTGSWYFGKCNLLNFPSRQSDVNTFSFNQVLSNWGVGEYWTPLIGDFNGDGLDDIAIWNSQYGEWQVALNNGQRLVPHQGKGDYTWLKTWATGSSCIPLAGDFNGDGLNDIMVWNTVTGDWQVALSTGNSFVPDTGRSDFSWLKGWPDNRLGWKPLIGDFDGDGKDDIAVWLPLKGEWRVALSTGKHFLPIPGPWLQPWAAGSGWNCLVGDFNGDGKSDVLAVDVVKGDWQIALSNGKEFKPYGDAFMPWAAGTDVIAMVGDFNGDGRTDIAARHPALRKGTIDIAVSVIT
ncbi:MAG: DUF2334 domain-containing protein [Syntrophomonadaceae bacterium]|nr:DUF2334 domain-containing protein [Syntrophomonadaceae bacterium]